MRVISKSITLILSLASLGLHLVYALDQATDFLDLGDSALSGEDNESAIRYYEKGIAALTDDESLLTILSLHTNLGTALSSAGNEKKAVDSYKTAIFKHDALIGEIVDRDMKKDANDLSAQAAFFLGMTYQELGEPQLAADAYALANTLDPYHWSSLANLGSVLHDNLRQPGDALIAYNKAFEILTQIDHEPTDAPHEPRYILSQLQYRIALAITYDHGRKCARDDDPTKEISCNELASHAFSLAVGYDSTNEAAKHMLASITADATVERASNTYVKALFDEYAHNFEHALVSELGYTGYERLRFGFDRAFGGRENVPIFKLVIDAGCGTGLVGEQFRNVSQYLVGVDLSQAIIDEAKTKRPDLYDETRAGDVTEVFRAMKPVSLIIAADSYIYFGDLVPLFKSMEEGVEDGGFVAFTLESVSEENEKSLQESKPDWRWQLTPSGRFAHKKEYVESVSKQHSFDVVHYEPLINFRYEGGVGVQGHVFVIQKKADDLNEL